MIYSYWDAVNTHASEHMATSYDLKRNDVVAKPESGDRNGPPKVRTNKMFFLLLGICVMIVVSGMAVIASLKR